MIDLCIVSRSSVRKMYKHLPGVVALPIVVLLGMFFVLGQGRVLAVAPPRVAQASPCVCHLPQGVAGPCVCRPTLPQRVTGPSFSITPFYSHKSHQLPRAYFTYNLLPDARIEDSIQVKNVGTARGSLKLYAVDALTAQTSGMAFHAHDDPRRDVGAWISLRSEPITLDAGETVDVLFSLIVPDRVRPGQHYGGIIAEPLDQSASQSAQLGPNAFGLHLQSLIILGVSVTLPGQTIERLGASGVNYDQLSQYQRVLLQLQNTGTQMLHPFGRLLILDQQRKQLQNIPLKLNAFLPQTAIAYPVYMSHIALLPGKTYIAKIHLQYEHNHSLDYTASFTVPPLPKFPPIPKVISSLVTPPASGDFFSRLTIWHYIIAFILLFFIITALLFWLPRIYKLATNLKRRLLS